MAPSDAPSEELTGFTRRMWIAVAAAVPLIVLTMGGMVGLPVRDWIGHQIASYLEFALATPVVGPNGHLIVCEDQYTDVVDNYLRGVTPDGALYPVARCRVQTELAGACFSPDGSTLFVDLYSPAKTLAITGPWTSVTV